jgi:hypothetical protein
MEPTITLINTALSSAKLIGGYSGYRFGRRKEDDMAVRRKLMIQLDTLRDHLINVMEDGDLDTRISSQKVIDVVDMFRNDIEIAETGHKYPFFSIQRSTSAGILKQLVKYDHQLISQLDSAIEATTVLEKAIAVGNMESGDAGLRTIKGFLSTARGFFENRIAIIQKVEKVQKVKK